MNGWDTQHPIYNLTANSYRFWFNISPQLLPRKGIPSGSRNLKQLLSRFRSCGTVRFKPIYQEDVGTPNTRFTLTSSECIRKSHPEISAPFTLWAQPTIFVWRSKQNRGRGNAPQWAPWGGFNFAQLYAGQEGKASLLLPSPSWYCIGTCLT